MKKLDKPDCVSQINEKEFNEFKDMIWNDRNQFINDLLKGHAYIVRNAVDKEKLSTLKKNVHEWGLAAKSSWNDVSDGVPNFHQIDDNEKFSESHFLGYKTMNSSTFFENVKGNLSDVVVIITHQRTKTLKKISRHLINNGLKKSQILMIKY